MKTKNWLIIGAVVSLFFSCGGDDLKIETVVLKSVIEKNLSAENDLENAVPHTTIARSVVNFLSSPDNGKEKKVLFIGYDGVRTDAIASLETVAVNKMVNADDGGLYFSYVGGVVGTDTEQQTYSGPGWATILTGEWADKHLFTGNSTEQKNDKIPSFLKRAELLDKKYVTNSLVTWNTINTNILKDELETLDYHYEAATDFSLFLKALNIASADDSDILSVIFDDPDHAGHAYGFHPFVKQYLNQISLTDSYAAKILEKIEERETYDKEDWLIIISTDHGGSEKSHGGQSEQERSVWIAINQKKYFTEDWQ